MKYSKALHDKSDINQWQMNDETYEEDDLDSLSEEGSSLDEITDSSDSNSKIKIADSHDNEIEDGTGIPPKRAAQMNSIQWTAKGSHKIFSFCQWSPERG